MQETKTTLALKESMAYLERNHRTEETMHLRLLLREAFATEVCDLVPMYSVANSSSLTEGERIAIASIAGSWSAHRLAAEINAAIARTNPLTGLADRRMPPVVGAYRATVESVPKHIKDDV